MDYRKKYLKYKKKYLKYNIGGASSQTPEDLEIKSLLIQKKTLQDITTLDSLKKKIELIGNSVFTIKKLDDYIKKYKIDDLITFQKIEFNDLLDHYIDYKITRNIDKKNIPNLIDFFDNYYVREITEQLTTTYTSKILIEETDNKSFNDLLKEFIIQDVGDDFKNKFLNHLYILLLNKTDIYEKQKEFENFFKICGNILSYILKLPKYYFNITHNIISDLILNFEEEIDVDDILNETYGFIIDMMEKYSSVINILEQYYNKYELDKFHSIKYTEEVYQNIQKIQNTSDLLDIIETYDESHHQNFINHLEQYSQSLQIILSKLSSIELKILLTTTKKIFEDIDQEVSKTMITFYHLALINKINQYTQVESYDDSELDDLIYYYENNLDNYIKETYISLTKIYKTILELSKEIHQIYDDVIKQDEVDEKQIKTLDNLKFQILKHQKIYYHTLSNYKELIQPVPILKITSITDEVKKSLDEYQDLVEELVNMAIFEYLPEIAFKAQKILSIPKETLFKLSESHQKNLDALDTIWQTRKVKAIEIIEDKLSNKTKLIEKKKSEKDSQYKIQKDINQQIINTINKSLTELEGILIDIEQLVNNLTTLATDIQQLEHDIKALDEKKKELEKLFLDIQEKLENYSKIEFGIRKLHIELKNSDDQILEQLDFKGKKVDKYKNIYEEIKSKYESQKLIEEEEKRRQEEEKRRQENKKKKDRKKKKKQQEKLQEKLQQFLLDTDDKITRTIDTGRYFNKLKEINHFKSKIKNKVNSIISNSKDFSDKVSDLIKLIKLYDNEMDMIVKIVKNIGNKTFVNLVESIYLNNKLNKLLNTNKKNTDEYAERLGFYLSDSDSSYLKSTDTLTYITFKRIEKDINRLTKLYNESIHAHIGIDDRKENYHALGDGLGTQGRITLTLTCNIKKISNKETIVENITDSYMEYFSKPTVNGYPVVGNPRDDIKSITIDNDKLHINILGRASLLFAVNEDIDVYLVWIKQYLEFLKIVPILLINQ